MSHNNLSLDDIIKQSKSTMRGRGGSYRGGKGGNQSNVKGKDRGITRNKRGKARPNNVTRGRSGKVITDARLKIIEKNRLKLTDAREKLAEIAKQTDARLKLDKLRASQFKKDAPVSGISCKTGRNGRITLTTNKGMPAASQGLGTMYRPHYPLPAVPNTPHYTNDINYIEPQTLRLTVNNEYAPKPPPPPPVFNFKPSTPYSWKRNDHTNFTNNWDFSSKTSTMPSISVDNKYYYSRTQRDIDVKSHLDAVPNKSGAMGVLVRPKSSSSSSQTTGYRIVVSNLQSNVTQEDIKELFEDVGDLVVSRLVRPGTAEVIYKTLKDAMKAVDTYHNRQLDGHPMKCLLVNPRPKNNPTGPAVRSLNENRRGTNSSYVQPSLGAVHRALFDD